MPHWFVLTITVAGSLSTFVAAVIALRKIVRAIREAWQQLLALLSRIETASKGISSLRQSLHELAGSFTTLAAALMQRQEDQAQQIVANSERLDALAELYTDISAALARLRRGNGGRDDTADPEPDPPAD